MQVVQLARDLVIDNQIIINKMKSIPRDKVYSGIGYAALGLLFCVFILLPLSYIEFHNLYFLDYLSGFLPWSILYILSAVISLPLGIILIFKGKLKRQWIIFNVSAFSLIAIDALGILYDSYNMFQLSELRLPRMILFFGFHVFLYYILTRWHNEWDQD